MTTSQANRELGIHASRLTRVIRILRLLQEGRGSSIDVIATQLRISRRTVFRDLSLLSSAGAAAKFDRATGRYVVVQSNLGAVKDVTPPETFVLLLMGHVLRTHPAIWDKRAADGLVEKLEAMIPDEMRRVGLHLLRHVTVLDQESLHEENIKQVIEALFYAVGHRRKVVVKYHHESGDSIDGDRLHPYHLVLDGGSWHLVAYSEAESAARMYEVDRIATVLPTRDNFAVSSEFDVHGFLQACKERYAS